jgi:hypothetical protein
MPLPVHITAEKNVKSILPEHGQTRMGLKRKKLSFMLSSQCANIVELYHQINPATHWQAGSLR